MKHALLLSLVAGVLRFVNLGQESLWYDEAFTAWLSKLSPDRLFQAIRGDVHPPLWYLIEWFNVRLFGTSEFALRLPSAILGIVSVLLVWRLALALKCQPRTALIAGLLTAVLPMGLYYGQDARMYSLLACFVLLMAWSAIGDHWLLFTLSAIGAMYSQNLGALYVVAIGLVVLVSRLRAWRSMIRPALAAAGIGAGYLPWLPTALHQISGVQSGYWIPKLSVGTALWALPSMTMGVRLPEQFQIPIYGVSIAIGLIGLINMRRVLLSRPGLILLAVVFGMPLIMALVSVVWQPIYLIRATLPSALAMCIVWAYPLNHLSKPNRRVAQAIVAPALLVGLYCHYLPALGRFDCRPWQARILGQWEAGDIVYHVTVDSAVLWRYYLPDQPYVVWPDKTDLSQSLTTETKTAMGIQEAALESQEYQRAWVFISRNPLMTVAEFQEMDRVLAVHDCDRIVANGNWDYVYQGVYLCKPKQLSL